MMTHRAVLRLMLALWAASVGLPAAGDEANPDAPKVVDAPKAAGAPDPSDTAPSTALRILDDQLIMFYGPAFHAGPGEDKAEAVYRAQIEAQLQRAEDVSGERARLQEEKYLSRKYFENASPPEQSTPDLTVASENVDPDPVPPQEEAPVEATIVQDAPPAELAIEQPQQPDPVAKAENHEINDARLRDPPEPPEPPAVEKGTLGIEKFIDIVKEIQEHLPGP